MISGDFLNYTLINAGGDEEPAKVMRRSSKTSTGDWVPMLKMPVGAYVLQDRFRKPDNCKERKGAPTKGGEVTRNILNACTPSHEHDSYLSQQAFPSVTCLLMLILVRIQSLSVFKSWICCSRRVHSTMTLELRQAGRRCIKQGI